MDKATAANAHRIITTSAYTEKQQALINAMLCTWDEVGTYNDLYRNIGKLTDEQQIDVAQAILDRRIDKQLEKENNYEKIRF